MSDAIPIGDARRISTERGQPVVVVFGVSADGTKFSVATYGASRALCKVAASLGKQFAEAVLGGRVSPPVAEPADLPDTPVTFAGEKVCGACGHAAGAHHPAFGCSKCSCQEAGRLA